MQFEDLKLIDSLLRAVRAEGYSTPTPIQQQAIPYVLEDHDLLAIAQTGTGKTAAFALPILQRLTQKPRQGNHIRVLVLAPTRELASQIGDSFRAYGRHTHIKATVIFGGVGQNPQVEALRRHPEVLVAAPGRLLDLMGQGYIKLDKIETFVLDEADRMLDMGFIHDVRRIVAALPRQRQTLLFSATMPEEIQSLAHDILLDPVKVEVTPPATTVELIQQSVFFVEKKEKAELLEHLLDDKSIARVLVFTRTKHGANKVVQRLERARINAEAIHGNKSQSAREKALANFKKGSTRVLVATDIAARGLDVDDITHIINYDLPNEPETYVHRIGRTARAGASGIAFSFCDTEEREYLRDIERLIRQHVPVAADHPYQSPLAPPPPTNLDGRGGSRPQQRSGNNRNGNRPQQPRRREGDRPQQPRHANSNGQHRSQPRPASSQGSEQPRRDRPQGEQRRNGQRQMPANRPQEPRSYGQQPQYASQPGQDGQRRYEPQRSQGDGRRERPYNDNRTQYNGGRRDDNRGNQPETPATPAQPVRRKRPLPPPDQREQPVLTDRFGNPIVIKPKNQPDGE
ncbi:MAG: DEAD/DEAH box helicase [Anaerolineae bacterium]